MQTLRSFTFPLAIVAVVATACAMRWPAFADDLEAPSTWDFPTKAQLESEFDDWTKTLALEEEAIERIDALWRKVDEAAVPESLAKTINGSLQAAMPEHEELLAQAMRGELISIPDLPLEDFPPIVKDNLKLLFGKSLALGQLYDESKDMLASVDPTMVADPAALFFYQGVAHYRLRDKDAGIEALDKLLERKDELPDRYANLAKLMRLDIESLEPDSLDEIARIMDSIKVRLGHGHAGTRVRKEEQDVVDKLDKMIEDLEEQLREMQAMAQGQANGLQSNAPAQDSSLPGGSAQGDVGRKALGDKTDWGNLPPKEREESLQRLGKEFPSHYRDIIEEYFRKLAQDEARDE